MLNCAFPLSTAVQEVPDNIPGSFQKAPPPSASTARLQVSSATSDSLQSSVSKIQDALAALQGRQHTEHIDFSESQDGTSMIPLTSDVFEKLLGSPNVELSTNPIRSVPESHQGSGCYTESVASPETQNSKTDCVAASKVPQDEFLEMPFQQATHGDKQKRNPVSKLDDGQQSSSHPKKISKVSRRKDSVAEKESTITSYPLKIPEALRSTNPVICKFCSETMNNADSLFRHYMETHKMKSGAALEFLRQYTFKRRRGRPPKGLTLRTPKPVSCPHCSVSFNNKNLCAVHIKSCHPNHLRDNAPVALSDSTMQDLPSGRLRKCSRCSFQTTTAKDFAAHIHSCQSNDAEEGNDDVAQMAEGKTNSSKKTHSEDKPKPCRGRKQSRDVQEDEVNNDDVHDVDNNDDVDDDEKERDETEEENEERSAASKGQVACPECNKKMSSRGLKRHQIRCTNKNRFVCTLCQHKSRESYDHTVHVDNHRTWVKALPNWLSTTGSDLKQSPSATSATPTASSVTSADSTPPFIPMDSNSTMADGNKEDFTSTVDLDALALITQIQRESDLLRQHQHILVSSGDGDTGHDLQESLISDTLLLPNAPNGDSVESNNAQSLDGEDKKSNSRDLKCKICYTWFGRTSLPKHMLQAHNMVKRFQCRDLLCRMIFAKLEDFKVHIAAHSKADMFRCGCRGCMKRRSVNPETLDSIRKEKMREYYKQMSHKCSKCWVKFPSLGSLDRHMKKESHHHPCSMCGKIQVSKRQLRMHMVTHQNERCFLCEVCGQNFKTKRDLNKHTFSHNNIRPFQCQECSKCFSFRNKMTRHMVTVHSAKKPFSCDWPECGRAFSRKDKLHDHAKTHLVTQPFRCKHCGKGFYRKDNLKDHEILHTGDFRFRCNLCNKGFMRPKILERHCLTEHSSMPTQVTLQATINQDGQTETQNQQISYVLCEPNYVYANIDQLTSFQDNVQEADVQEADVQLMQGQHATIEEIQNAAAAVIGNGQNQFQMDGADAFPVNITLGT